MGRRLSLYGLKRAEALSALDEMLKLDIQLDEWGEEFRADATLAAARAQAGEALGAENWAAIVDFKYALPQKLQPKQGIVEVFATSATNPSCVFMEQFFDWLPDAGVERSADGYDFLLSPELLADFLAKFTDLLRVFVLRTQEEYWYLAYEMDTPYRAWAEAFYDAQHTERQRLGDNYSDKWATDYFSFSWYYWELASLLENVADYDFYLLCDSY